MSSNDQVDALHSEIAKLQKNDTFKSKYISIASHDLRASITAITGLSTMVMDGDYGKVDNDLIQPLGDIKTSTGKLLILIDDLLTLSRIGEGRLKFELTSCNLLEILSETVYGDVKILDVNPVSVQVDQSKLKQIIVSLIKYISENNSSCYIRVIPQLVPDCVSVVVSSKLLDDSNYFRHTGEIPNGMSLKFFVSQAFAEKIGGSLDFIPLDDGSTQSFVLSLPVSASTRAKQTLEIIEEEARNHPDQIDYIS